MEPFSLASWIAAMALLSVGILRSRRGGGGRFRSRPGQQTGNTAAGGTIGGQSVAFSRTAVGAEGSFTTTTVTLPASAIPTNVQLAVSASSAQVQIVSMGKRFWSGVVTTNLPLTIDISALPEGTTVDVQTECNAALVISGVVGYT